MMHKNNLGLTTPSCYVCGAKGAHIERDAREVYLEDDDHRTVYVGPSCFKKVQKAAHEGLKPRLGGPRVFATLEQARSQTRGQDALMPAGQISPPYQAPDTYDSILFLDFDGVLHRSGSSALNKMPQLCQFLRRSPHVGVVISSSWRTSRAFKDLKALFAPDVQHQILSVTPDLPASRMGGSMTRIYPSRCTEIQEWLKLRPEVKNFAILDDEIRIFRNLRDHLVLTNPEEGLTELDLDQVEERLHGL